MGDFPPRIHPRLPPLVPGQTPRLLPFRDGTPPVRHAPVIEARTSESEGRLTAHSAALESAAAKLAPHGYRCKVCKAHFPVWQPTCGGCESKRTLVSDVSNASVLPRVRTPEQIGVRPVPRIITHNRAFDLVMGGGVPVGTMTLVLGKRGSGKSTMLFQTAITCEAERPLLISSEESEQELQDRMTRFDEFDRTRPGILFTKDAREAIRAIREYESDYVVLDSLQKFYDPSIDGVMGGVLQVTRFTNTVYAMCKNEKYTITAVSRQTKSGAAAGGANVEYEVDAVIGVLKGHGQRRALDPKKTRYSGGTAIPCLLLREGMVVDDEAYSKTRNGKLDFDEEPASEGDDEG